MSAPAIETRYQGYRFRSRLEARYAVFFTVLGIAWEYEAEGFDLGANGWYLPDFRLAVPNFEPVYVEVKPKHQQADQYWRKARALAASGVNVLLLGGDPGMRSDTLCLGNPVDQRRYSGSIVLQTEYGPEALVNYGRGRLIFSPRSDDYTKTEFSDTQLAAVRAAKGARFEHGESGA